jgi:hypothetical protein
MSLSDTSKLKRLLILYNSEYPSFLISEDAIIKYTTAELESDRIASLYEFRIANDTDKNRISYIQNIINAIKENKEFAITLHYLEVTNGRQFSIFTDINCEKILGVFSPSIRSFQ